MNATARRPRWAAGAACAALLATCCGCPFTNPNGSDVPFLDSSGNSTFGSATKLPLADTDTLEFDGRIDGATDLDIYQLGQLSSGDRVFVDVQADTTDLDLVAAIFDSQQHLQDYNDDRTADASNLNPRLDFVLREQSDAFYLAIAPYTGSTATGGYRVTIQITRAVGVPPSEAQIVFLNWAGGQNIVIPQVGTFNLPPFDASDLGPFGNRTADMKKRVQQIVADRYAGYDLILQNSDDNPVPTKPHSTVYFGGSNAQAFAISEQIDMYNADASDDAIVFTKTFQSAFTGTPTFEQMAQAVGNTVAHEVGHLLGLVHTSDCNDLMDSGCYNDRMLSPQSFSTAKLSSATFPVGYQAARELLEWILGFVGLS